MISDTRLDHVAVAVERHADAWPRYAGDLAGRWLSAGLSIGFAPAQLEYQDGRKIEVLAPHRVADNDFLRRFLDRNGPGPHHLTFKVGDIEEALAEATLAGYAPLNVDLSDPIWKEAFLHPKDATGVLVQLAQAEGQWRTPPPDDLPAPRTPDPAALVHVAHAVVSLEDGLRLFSALLGGHEERRGKADHHQWVDLVWGEGGRVRLVAPSSEGSPLWSWLGARPGRLLHLGFTCDDPAGVSGARAGGSAWSVAPADNLGTGLVLVPTGSSALDDGPIALSEPRGTSPVER
jgi:methylmalonyl-CoA/ethylmalonyl-CoA epimerase